MTPADGPKAAAHSAPSDVLDTETIDTVIDSLLRADPPPYALAADESGLCVPLPATVPLPPDHAIGGVASALELFIPSDLQAIVEAWARARVRRGSQTVVRLRRDPDRRVTVHFIDARHRFGVYLAVFVGTEGRFDDGNLRAELFRPRVCSYERDEVSVVLAIDDAFTRILGWTAAEVVGTRTLEFTHPDDRAVGIANWMEMLARPGSEQRLLMRYRHRDGAYVWFEVTNRNFLSERGRVVSELVDVSERMEAVEALRASERLLRRLTEALPLGVVQIDAAGRIVYRNERAVDILGGAEATTLEAQFAGAVEADRAYFAATASAVLERTADADLDITLGEPPDAKRCSIALRPLSADDGTVSGAIVCVTDVTERVRLYEELERRAKYDQLTHCHNRAAILDALHLAMLHRANASGGIAVVFVDLDGFKAVNDRHGHAAGDELLRVTGQRLLTTVRTCDIVGRLGGDEFLVVCPDVASPDIALEIGRRIAAALTAPTRLGTTSIEPGSSIGVAWTDRAIDADAIVASADRAMYEAKRGAPSPVLALR